MTDTTMAETELDAQVKILIQALDSMRYIYPDSVEDYSSAVLEIARIAGILHVAIDQ